MTPETASGRTPDRQNAGEIRDLRQREPSDERLADEVPRISVEDDVPAEMFDPEPPDRKQRRERHAGEPRGPSDPADAQGREHGARREIGADRRQAGAADRTDPAIEHHPTHHRREKDADRDRPGSSRGDRRDGERTDRHEGEEPQFERWERERPADGMEHAEEGDAPPPGGWSVRLGHQVTCPRSR